MNINDFQYMWRGKSVRPLTDNEAHFLLPVDIHNSRKNKALLLLHGFSSSPAIYRAFIPKLISVYDAISCPVLPGHADCIAAFAKVTANHWLDAATKAYQTLAQEYETVDVLGLSLGGLLACKLSEKFKINHLYLLAPALALHLPVTLALNLARFLKLVGFKQLRNHAGNFHMRNGYEELTYRRLPISAIIEMLSLVQELKFTLPTCPTDLFLGRFDEVVDSNIVEKLFLNCPTTTIHWLENSAHILPLDGDINAILNCIRANN